MKLLLHTLLCRVLFACVMCQAAEFGTEMLDEDGLFNLIRKLPGKKSKYTIAAENERLQVCAAIEMPNFTCCSSLNVC